MVHDHLISHGSIGGGRPREWRAVPPVWPCRTVRTTARTIKRPSAQARYVLSAFGEENACTGFRALWFADSHSARANHARGHRPGVQGLPFHLTLRVRCIDGLAS